MKIKEIDVTFFQDEVILDAPSDEQKHVLAVLGYFDGMHLGHQKIFQRAQEESLRLGKPVVVITFDMETSLPKHETLAYQHRLLPMKDKLAMFERMGVETVYLLHFDETMKRVRADVFIQCLVKKLALSEIIVGQDYRFGFERQGDTALLASCAKRLGIGLKIVPEYQNIKLGEKVSTSIIRQEIITGNIEVANKLLGYDYHIIGEVVHGLQKGRTLGFPTANIQPSFCYVFPKRGVYVSFVEVEGKKFKAMTNVGFAPTIKTDNKLVIETHLLDFDQDIYGQNLCVSFLKKIRDEKKFDTIAALKRQIKKDLAYAQAYFKVGCR